MINSIIRFFAKGGLWILLFTAVYKFTFFIINIVNAFKSGGGYGAAVLIQGLFDLALVLSALTIVIAAAKKMAKDLPPVMPHNAYLMNNYNQGMPNGQYPNQQVPNQQYQNPQAPVQQPVYSQQVPPMQQAPVQQMPQAPVQPQMPVQQTPAQPQMSVQQEPAAPASGVWFCSGCGTQNIGENMFCSKCGKPK